MPRGKNIRSSQEVGKPVQVAFIIPAGPLTYYDRFRPVFGNHLLEFLPVIHPAAIRRRVDVAFDPVAFGVLDIW